MKKNWLDHKIIQIGLTSFLVIAASILFYFFVRNITVLFNFISGIIKILKPLIVGLILAYIMNPLVKLFDHHVFNKVEKETTRRNLSIACTVIIIIALLATLISIIIPQLLLSFQSLIVNVPTYINNIGTWIKEWVRNSNVEANVLKNYDTISEYIINTINNVLLPSTNQAISTLGNGLFSFVSFIINLAIGSVFAVYILANTSTFSANIKKTLYSLFDVNKVNSFYKEMNHINDVFGHFMIGKVCDSSLVATITFLFLLIFGFPYPLLIAVLIGLTDLIPYFGPYIGSIPSALLIMLVSPVKAVTFIIFIIVLQQIDGNLITPRIQKQATGLPSFWVLFAITLFGGLFGVVGMIIGVPCFTIIFELCNDFINSKLKKKNIPTETEYYEEHTELEEKIIKSKLAK